MRKVNRVLKNYLDNIDSPKHKAATNIKNLLCMLDLNVEVVPENNLSMLTRLITSLKGQPLTAEEKELLIEITNKN